MDRAVALHPGRPGSLVTTAPDKPTPHKRKAWIGPREPGRQTGAGSGRRPTVQYAGSPVTGIGTSTGPAPARDIQRRSSWSFQHPDRVTAGPLGPCAGLSPARTTTGPPPHPAGRQTATGPALPQSDRGSGGMAAGDGVPRSHVAKPNPTREATAMPGSIAKVVRHAVVFARGTPHRSLEWSRLGGVGRHRDEGDGHARQSRARTARWSRLPTFRALTLVPTVTPYRLIASGPRAVSGRVPGVPKLSGMLHALPGIPRGQAAPGSSACCDAEGGIRVFHPKLGLRSGRVGAPSDPW